MVLTVPTAAVRGPRHANSSLVLLTLCLAVFVVNVSTTVINIALPTLVRELDATTGDLLWIVDAFNLAFAALVLAAGSLSDRFGRRPALVLGLALFGAASMIGAWSDSPGELILWRAVAGIAAAVVYPVTLSILANVFVDRAERVRAIGIWGAATGLSVAAGPVVGGALVENFWWGSILLFNGAAAVLALLLTLVLVPDSRDPSTPPIDVPGLVLSTTALGLLVYSIIEAPDRGWSSPTTLIGFTVAAVVLFAFVMHERRVEHPMLDVLLFTNLRFTAASGAVTSAFFALFGFIFLVTQYFQSVREYGPLDTGLRILPVAVSLAAFSLIGPRLAMFFGSKAVVALGLASLSTAFFWASTIGQDTDYLVIVGQMVLLGGGLGLTSAPATEAIMGVVPPEKAGMGSAVNDATRELGGTLGVAVIGSVSLSMYRDHLGHPPVPDALLEPARESIGGAEEAARQAAEMGEVARVAGEQVLHLAREGFVQGFEIGCIVAGAVTAVAAILTLIYLPAHPDGDAHP
ncbi:MFS transporter [Rhodococcus sp. IEGM 1408]|uniref:MFS transporter n=1 Tax=Rhodococcus sp. IEGM 1408 TaxID=3082220 RepID=UPI002953666C|nr:MFS transporter [Rhodococcus sp. IEGM 1408]MDV8001419.1 MFS transporter [Rhodococcus sp. IEGM 1408]